MAPTGSPGPVGAPAPTEVPIPGSAIAMEALTPVGAGLHRPECVLATARGDLYVSDWRGGITHLLPDGTQRLHAAPAPGGGTLHPNGIALRVDGIDLPPTHFAFEDAEGRVWITVSTRRAPRALGYRPGAGDGTYPGGTQHTMIEDADPEHVAWAEAAYRDGTMGRPHLDGVRSRLLRNVSSMAFGGPGLRTAWLGCLLGDTLMRFDAPVAGHPPPHWHS